MTNGNGGYVTWKGLITTALVCLGFAGSAATAAWQVHSHQPHKGAMTDEEFGLYARSLEKRLDRLEAKLDQALLK